MTDLNALIGNVTATETTPPTTTDETDLSNAEAISGLMDSMILLSSGFEALDKTLCALSNRMDTLEKHLSYLLTKDPVVGPQMIEAARKIKEEAAK